MTKTNRQISIDFDINKKLRETKNASGLIEELLFKHFNANLSNDINFLTKEIEETDLKIKNLENIRENMTNRVRIINEKNRDQQDTEKAKKIIEIKAKGLNGWLSEKVKTNEITFEDYINIRDFSNWEDCLEAVINEKMTLNELVEKVNNLKQREAIE